jgi:hypothetical protein
MQAPPSAAVSRFRFCSMGLSDFKWLRPPLLLGVEAGNSASSTSSSVLLKIIGNLGPIGRIDRPLKEHGNKSTLAGLHLAPQSAKFIVAAGGPPHGAHVFGRCRRPRGGLPSPYEQLFRSAPGDGNCPQFCALVCGRDARGASPTRGCYCPAISWKRKSHDFKTSETAEAK